MEEVLAWLAIHWFEVCILALLVWIWMMAPTSQLMTNWFAVLSNDLREIRENLDSMAVNFEVRLVSIQEQLDKIEYERKHGD